MWPFNETSEYDYRARASVTASGVSLLLLRRLGPDELKRLALYGCSELRRALEKGTLLDLHGLDNRGGLASTVEHNATFVNLDRRVTVSGRTSGRTTTE